MKKLEKIDGSNFLWNLYMKTEVMSFTMSKNFTIFNDIEREAVFVLLTRDPYQDLRYRIPINSSTDPVTFATVTN